ncbi:MAG: gamma-glutamylcyclotransferase family protein [Paracoccaceae bacterium]
MPAYHIFGYGSLVNGATHRYGAAHLATLSGWRRAWRYTNVRDVAFLNVAPAPGSTVKGVIVAVPRHDPELDEREYTYLRETVSDVVRHALPAPVEIDIFTIPDGRHQSTSNNHMILLSYLDVVVQGFAHQYGEAGVQEFFETTDGWDVPVIDDRATPRYPRHQQVARELRSLTDQWLRTLSAVVKRP